MRSWKARLLILLTILAMFAALGAPAIANDNLEGHPFLSGLDCDDDDDDGNCEEDDDNGDIDPFFVPGLAFADGVVFAFFAEGEDGELLFCVVFENGEIECEEVD